MGFFFNYIIDPYWECQTSGGICHAYYCQICAKKTATTKKQQAEEIWKKHKGWTLDLWKCVFWSDESKIELYASSYCVCVMQKRWTDGLYMHGCHWSMGEEVLVLECFAECTLNQHGSHSSDMPSQQTSKLSGVLTKEDSDDLASKVTRLNPIEIFWDQMDSRFKEKGTTRSQRLWSILQDCCKSISGDHLLTLTPRMQNKRVCESK